jgi:hypothetical protein
MKLSIKPWPFGDEVLNLCYEWVSKSMKMNDYSVDLMFWMSNSCFIYRVYKLRDSNV